MVDGFLVLMPSLSMSSDDGAFSSMDECCDKGLECLP